MLLGKVLEVVMVVLAAAAEVLAAVEDQMVVLVTVQVKVVLCNLDLLA